MWWFVFALTVVGFIGWLIWFRQKWITPWRRAENLVEAIANDRPPQGFLLTANPLAHRLGLALEKTWDRQHELVESAHEKELNFQAILGAMLDGLVVLDEQRHIQMTNPAFARLVDRESIAP